MSHIRRLKITLPAHMAGIAPSAAREIAERMVDAAYGTDGLSGIAEGGTVTLEGAGRTPAQIGLAAGQSLQKTRSSS